MLDEEKPGWMVVQGDTATAIAGALAAHYGKKRVAHVETGLGSGDIHHPWPEEVSRKIVCSFVRSAPRNDRNGSRCVAARKRPSRDDPCHLQNRYGRVYWVIARIEREPALPSGLTGLEARFAGKRINGMTTHRRENFGEQIEAIASAVRRLAALDHVAVIFSVHLSPNVRAVMNDQLAGQENVALIEPLDYPHFVRLLHICTPMLRDSGEVQEETPALGKPVLVMR